MAFGSALWQAEAWVLEIATELNPGAAWSPVGETPEVSGDLNVLTLDAVGHEHFFRLRSVGQP